MASVRSSLTHNMLSPGLESLERITRETAICATKGKTALNECHSIQVHGAQSISLKDYNKCSTNNKGDAVGISDKGDKLRVEEEGRRGYEERTSDVLSESTAWCDVL